MAVHFLPEWRSIWPRKEHLVGGWGWPTPLKKIRVRQLGWIFPIYGKIKVMFQTTNQTSSHSNKYLKLAWKVLLHGSRICRVTLVTSHTTVHPTGSPIQRPAVWNPMPVLAPVTIANGLVLPENIGSSLKNMEKVWQNLGTLEIRIYDRHSMVPYRSWYQEINSMETRLAMYWKLMRRLLRHQASVCSGIQTWQG